MGFLFSKIIQLFSRSKNNFKIVLLGIQNAGKTTILYRLSIGQLVKTSPTIGSNVEEISYNNIKFNAWDLGGQESMRSVWDVYYMNTDAIIYVIDSNDVENYEESKIQFYKLLKHEALKNAVILIFANKQDLITAKKVDEIIKIYNLDSIKTHCWQIFPCSAETGEGLINGLQWLSDKLVDKSNNKFPNNPYSNTDLNLSSRALKHSLDHSKDQSFNSSNILNALSKDDDANKDNDNSNTTRNLISNNNDNDIKKEDKKVEEDIETGNSNKSNEK